MSTASSPSRRGREACPVCGLPSTSAYAPFCRQGCRDRDLLNWLGDRYRVPGRWADETLGESGPDGLDTER